MVTTNKARVHNDLDTNFMQVLIFMLVVGQVATSALYNGTQEASLNLALSG